MASTASSTVVFCFFLLLAAAQSVEFIFHGFNSSETSLTREGASIIKPTGLLRLTNNSHHVIGHAFYSQPIQMFDVNSSSSSRNSSSFSTSFVFAIVPSSSEGGYGLAFTLSPSPSFPGAGTEHYLGIFNSLNDGNEANHIFAVEFDTVKGHNETEDTHGNHVAININSVSSIYLEPAVYFVNGIKEELALEGDKPIHAWIDYDGVNKIVNVTICPLGEEKTTETLLSKRVDLTPVVKETMYVGFSASTGRKSSSHYILGWSFSTDGEAPALNISKLPTAPGDKRSSNRLKSPIIFFIAALSVVTVLLLVSLISLTVYKRMTRYENLEDWELDCPHRFRYKDLYKATKGFKESEVIGLGGFGAVYRGVLPAATASEVAVKRIARNSVQGMREFAAEIESLGRLRHKHLVNLQGWCKRKNDLLLVYDYICNGSLDTLLFNPKDNFVLSWAQRFEIIKGIGAGLLYLHEEWEKVVIHRDVKSSNVLIDAEMNARLGDFGLARLYEHGTASHTTNVVGTIGYIAPELARNGKASTGTDVFAFGVLLLEIATGRRPIGSGNFFLVDWVMECQQMCRILDAADTKLNSDYVAEEMKLVLELGLLCSHQRPDCRPTMRRVMRYLNGDDPLPYIDDWGSTDSQSISEINSRLLQGISQDTIMNSYHSLSIGAMSSNSLSGGR